MGKKRRRTSIMTFAIGERVCSDEERSWGRSHFEGIVVSCFLKRDRASLRYVVESDLGWVQIFKPDQLAHIVEVCDAKS